VRVCVLIVALLLASPLRAAELPPAAEQKIDFARDIRPLLSQHCWSCHGEKKQESGLRLDRKASALHGGDDGKVLVVGKSAESRLIKYVAGLDAEHRMPPEGEGELLSAASVGLLRAWIDQGLHWPASAEVAAKTTHWAYQPIRRVAPPDVKPADWGRSAIDRFILAELGKHGMQPSPEADRPALIRRLYLDLLGLLPPPEEVAAFANDARPDAYERLVDRLLASPHFGERWGRHWLDMARYADSDGYEKDNPRPDAFRWRDWVIEAINADMPFDQFTVEQLAGDLLPSASPYQKLATAFHRQTLTNTEGGTDQEQFRVEACFDRTETTGAVWLGLTVGCARCHTHKYDAITQREYYQLFAFFNNGDEQTTPVPKTEAEIAEYAVLKKRYDEQLAAALGKLMEAQKVSEPAFQAWLVASREKLKSAGGSPVKLHALEEAKVSSDGDVTFTKQDDGSFLAGGANPDQAIYIIETQTAIDGIAALRLDVLPDKSLPAEGPGRVAHGNFVLSEVTLEVADTADFAAPRKLEFAAAKADHEQDAARWPAKDVFDRKPATGWAISPQFGKPHWIVLHLKEPLAVKQPVFLRIKLSQNYGSQHTIGRFKLSLQTGIEPEAIFPPEITKLLRVDEEKLGALQREKLREHFDTVETSTKALAAAVAAVKKQEPPKPEVAARVFVQRTANLRATFVLKRGEFLEPIKDADVPAGALATLPPLTAREAGQPADRLDLARWLVSPDHPLTPRVTANHVWRMLFGNGLVRTPNDFGVRGEPPTHPALLDYLASELVAQGWSRKQLIRQIVLSSTYRQASAHRRELAESDPQNVYLARQNRWRVEGEVLRDISLDAAGLLAPQIGGASVFPPLPPGIAELSYAGNFTWKESAGADRYRRGMYTFFKRTSPHPNLTMFDCPDANLTCIERKNSNTPLQALTTLNNSTFAECAQHMAKRVLADKAKSTDERLATAFQYCLSRAPRAVEAKELAQLLDDAKAWYRTHPDDAMKVLGAHGAAGAAVEELAAWVSTLRVLLNLDEFVTRG
jgi:hypothetical protein